MAALNLTICGKDELSPLLANKYSAIISIHDPGRNRKWSEVKRAKRKKQFETIHCHTVLCLDFFDTENDAELDGPRIIHIQTITEFAKRIEPGSDVLIHCRMGVSRSTAAAMILLMEHGMTRDAALNEVKRVRPVADPNTLMLKLYQDHVTQPLQPLQ